MMLTSGQKYQNFRQHRQGSCICRPQCGTEAAKQAFIHTAAGKAVAVAVSVAVIGGGGAAAYHFIGRSHAGEEPQKAVEVNQAETTDTVSSQAMPEPTEVPEPTVTLIPTAIPTPEPTPTPAAADPASVYTDVVNAAAAGEAAYTFPEYANGDYGQPTGENWSMPCMIWIRTEQKN